MFKRALQRSCLCLLPLPGFSLAEVDITGELGGTVRYFPDAPVWAGQDRGTDVEYVIEPSLTYVSDTGSTAFAVEGFLRGGSQDSHRNHSDLRVAVLSHEMDGADIRVGVDKVFWGTTESRHVVDIINQTDLVEELRQEEKLGQPMFNLNLYRDWGKLAMYWLPYFRERTYPAIEGRQRLPFPVAVDAPEYEAGESQRTNDFAVRYSHYIGDFDFGFYAFDGIAREPILRFDEVNDAFTPLYVHATQLGFDGQYTVDAWLWKHEHIYQSNDYEDYFASASGVEYTFYGALLDRWDVGVLAEYLYSGRSEGVPELFDDDVFLGTRVSFNDVAGSSLLAGVYRDTDSDDFIYLVEFEARVTAASTVTAKVEAFDAEQSLLALNKDDLVSVTYKIYY